MIKYNKYISPKKNKVHLKKKLLSPPVIEEEKLNNQLILILFKRKRKRKNIVFLEKEGEIFHV